MNQRRFYGQVQFRVWPDGTIQCVEDGDQPYPWMSDDYTTVWAQHEEEALAKVLGHRYEP